MTHTITTRFQVNNPTQVTDKAPETRQKILAAGAKRVEFLQPIAAGPHVDVMLVISSWDSVDAGLNALAGLYADPDIQAITAANPMLGREISTIMKSRGDIEGQYVGMIRGTATELSDRGFERTWEIGNPLGITAIRASRSVAGGNHVGSYRALLFCNSVDAWVQTSAQLRADDEYLEEAARTNWNVIFRGVARRL